MTLPQLSIGDEITILRTKYPAGIVCTRCARLLATGAGGQSRSSLSDEQRLAYVCAGCRDNDRAAAETSSRLRAIRRPEQLGKADGMLLVVGTPAGPPATRRALWEREASYQLLGVISPRATGRLVDGRVLDEAGDEIERLASCPRCGGGHAYLARQPYGACAYTVAEGAVAQAAREQARARRRAATATDNIRGTGTPHALRSLPASPHQSGRIRPLFVTAEPAYAGSEPARRPRRFASGTPTGSAPTAHGSAQQQEHPHERQASR